jgi:AAA15 family ATPase/GTPase
MLVEFSVSNFRSFKGLQVLPMQAAPISSNNQKLDEENLVLISESLSLLKTKAIFGANAGGKSNVIRALSAMLTIVDDCVVNKNIIEEAVLPFHLNIPNQNRPTFFQLIFTLNGMLYRYGFEVLRNEVLSEWLFGKSLQRVQDKKLTEKYYFKREGMKVTVNSSTFKEGKRFDNSDSTQAPVHGSNTLFLRVMAIVQGEISKSIHGYFNSIAFIDDYTKAEFYDVAKKRLIDKEYLLKLSDVMMAVDPTVSRIDLRTISKPGAADEHIPIVIRNYADGSQFGHPLLGMEAEGTKKVFAMSPYIFDALKTGQILVVDEFDARMHPRLTRQIIELFHSPVTNPKGAQLIFVSHDTNLLDNSLLRRDQILFANKGNDGATELYSLVQIKGVRNDSLYGKEYLLGKYRAVPNNLNTLEEPFTPYGNAEENKGG